MGTQPRKLEMNREMMCSCQFISEGEMGCVQGFMGTVGFDEAFGNPKAQVPFFEFFNPRLEFLC